jgi:hypothetical protein
MADRVVSVADGRIVQTRDNPRKLKPAELRW